MGAEQRSARDDDTTEPPVRFAGQPVPVGRSPWSQPPRQQPPRLQLPRQQLPRTAPGVHQVPSRVDMTPRPASPRESLERDFGGPRQITVVNPAPRSGKTAAVNALHATFRQVRTDVVAWDSHGLSGVEFDRERDRLARTYKVLIVDTADAAGPALDATDQLVVAVDSRLDSVRAAEATLAELEASDQAALARNAVVVVSTTSEPDGNHGAATAQRFATRTRAVFVGTDAWDRIAQAVADGL